AGEPAEEHPVPFQPRADGGGAPGIVGLARPPREGPLGDRPAAFAPGTGQSHRVHTGDGYTDTGAIAEGRAHYGQPPADHGARPGTPRGTGQRRGLPGRRETDGAHMIEPTPGKWGPCPPGELERLATALSFRRRLRTAATVGL